MSEEENKGMTREEAEALMKEWAEAMELDTNRELFSDLVEVLSYTVQKERLTFETESEVFKYQLIKPVNGKALVEIHETSFEEKKILQRYKKDEGMDAEAMMMAKHTNLSPADVLKLKSRDQNRIAAVIQGFLSK